MEFPSSGRDHSPHFFRSRLELDRPLQAKIQVTERLGNNTGYHHILILVTSSEIISQELNLNLVTVYFLNVRFRCRVRGILENLLKPDSFKCVAMSFCEAKGIFL